MKENKNYEYPTGYFLREKIYNFILKHGLRKGVKSGEISKHVIFKDKPISRTTRALHLKELKQQRRIYYKNGLYFPQDLTFGDIRNFAECMKNAYGMMVNTTLIDPLPADEKLPTSTPLDTRYVEFDSTVRGISVSHSLCKTNFAKDKLNEKYLFEFANRIGAYITYILIESLRPLDQFDILTPTSGDDKLKRRALLSSDLINMAINMKSIFEDCFFEIIRSFEPSLTTEPYFKPHKAQYFPHFELNKNDFDRLSETFRNVYPGIYRALERKWKDEVDLKTNLVEYREREEGLKCDHKWEETSIYKLGKYYFCAKCYEFVSNNFMKYLSKLKDERRDSTVRILMKKRGRKRSR